MARRTTQLFSLSMLDLLTGALGAIIFLFVITPKGGKSAAATQQAVVYFDKAQMKIHGSLPDSLLDKNPGDTLLVVMADYKKLPKRENAPQKVLAKNELPSPKKTTPKKSTKVQKETPPKKEVKPKVEKKTPVKKVEPKKEKTTTTEKTTKRESTTTTKKEQTYRGSPPSVPAAVSFEINWVDKNDNVDLIVCKSGKCVYGGRKRNRDIGQWDSGKSRNRLFGNDLRTNQEAVRQFDKVIPGEYQIYAQFKESKKKRNSVTIKGLIYTKDKSKQERGENFSRKLPLTAERVLIGIVKLNANGEFQFFKK